MWTLRLLFEFMSHAKACFITLTYDTDNLPYNLYGETQLCKKDIQDFMKRLRKKFSDVEIRFYCAGEYGTRRKRPHYHLIIFGLDFADYGLDINQRSEVLTQLWSFGLNHVGACNVYTIQYVAGYVLKKFVNKKRDTITPEFTLMSRRPGIGFYALSSYLQLYSSNNSFIDYINKTGSLPSTVMFGGRTYPLDRYFKWKLSDTLGFSEKQAMYNFIAKTLQRQHEAFKQGFSDLAQFELAVDEQSRKNRISKLNIFTRTREDL